MKDYAKMMPESHVPLLVLLDMIGASDAERQAALDAAYAQRMVHYNFGEVVMAHQMARILGAAAKSVIDARTTT